MTFLDQTCRGQISRYLRFQGTSRVYQPQMGCPLSIISRGYADLMVGLHHVAENTRNPLDLNVFSCQCQEKTCTSKGCRHMRKCIAATFAQCNSYVYTAFSSKDAFLTTIAIEMQKGRLFPRTTARWIFTLNWNLRTDHFHASKPHLGTAERAASPCHDLQQR